MNLKGILIFGLLSTSSVAVADAKYTLACSMRGSTAKVYVCNSGNSAEGNNEYVTVDACTDSGCDDDYDLMYIYATPGDCELVGEIDFGEEKEFCIAKFRE